MDSITNVSDHFEKLNDVLGLSWRQTNNLLLTRLMNENVCSVYTSLVKFNFAYMNHARIYEGKVSCSGKQHLMRF